MAHNPGTSSPQAAPAPSRSRLVVDRVVRGAALPGGPRGTRGTYTPHPRPLSPSRGEGCHARFPLQLKTQHPPLAPVKRGRGVGGEGGIPAPWEGEAPAEPPECLTVLRLSRSFALPLWPTIRASVHRRLPALPPLPHGRGSWLPAWCVGRHCEVAHVKQGGLHPSPPTPLPFQGRGVPGVCRAAIAG